ncbi:hypothetical protein CHUAL_004760 [Chamberlinius hualienensis]
MDLVQHVFTLAKNFQQLQEERVHVYHLFNEAHKIYLNTAPQYEFQTFKEFVHKVTEQFKRISQEIIVIENTLREDCGNASLADHIKNIQEAEKKKLEFTAHLQLARQNAIDMPNEPEREIAVLEYKQRLNQIIGIINDYLEEVRYEVVDL